MSLTRPPLLALLLRTLLALIPLAALSMQGLTPWQNSTSLVLICAGLTLWVWQKLTAARVLLGGAIVLLCLNLMLSLTNDAGSLYPLSLLFSALAALLLPQQDKLARLTAGTLALLCTCISSACLFSMQLQLTPVNGVLTALTESSPPLWAPLLTGSVVFIQLQRWRCSFPLFRSPALAPVVLLLGIITTLYVALLAEHQLQQELKQQSLQRNSQLASDLLDHLGHQNQAMERLAQQWAQMQEMPKPVWQRQAQLLMENFDNFYSIEWIDNDLMIRWLEPSFADPNILNFRFQPSHPAYPYLMLARTTRQQITSGVYRLIPGDLGFTVYTPIFISPEQQQGFLVSVYQLAPFITNILRNPIYADYSLRVLFQGQMVYHSPSFVPRAPMTTQVIVPGPLNWQLQLQPNLPHLGAHLAPLLMCASGLLMSLLLGLSLYLIRHYLRQQAITLAGNTKLQEEIGQRQLATQTLMETNRQMELFYDLINQSRDALLIVNPDNHELIYYNSSTYSVLGYHEEDFLQALGQNHGELREALDELIERAQQSRRRFGSAVYEMELPRQDQSLLPVEVSIRTVNKDKQAYLTIVLHDVTAHKELQQRLLEMATKDPLTQINNRRQFDAELKTEWARMLRSQQPLSLLIMDVDHFKNYNDSLGHQQGDSCLRTIANLMQSALSRVSDSAARYGGEEFAVILPETDRCGAELVADNMHHKLAQAAIPHPASPTSALVTISIGSCTLTPSANRSVDELIRRADQALYQAKHAGRNCTRMVVGEDIPPAQLSDSPPSLP